MSLIVSKSLSRGFLLVGVSVCGGLLCREEAEMWCQKTVKTFDLALLFEKYVKIQSQLTISWNRLMRVWICTLVCLIQIHVFKCLFFDYSEDWPVVASLMRVPQCCQLFTTQYQTKFKQKLKNTKRNDCCSAVCEIKHKLNWVIVPKRDI